MEASCQDPHPFVRLEKSLFSLNKDKKLQEYCLGFRISTMLIAEYLLKQQKPALLTAITANPDILYQEVFPPTTINTTNLCATSLRPTIPWNPDFDYVPPIPPKATHPIAVQNLPPILLTTIPPSSAVLTVSAKFFSIMNQPIGKLLTTQLIWMSLLICYLPLANRKIHPHFMAPFHPSNTHHNIRPAQYPQTHAFSPLCMKPLILSFTQRIACN